MSKFAQVLATTRPNFMLLSPLCILLGIAAAAHEPGTLDIGWMLVAMLGGVLAHVAVNMLNEYGDFHSGLDAITERTPFSGGTGTLPAHPAAAPATLIGGLACIAATAIIGVSVIWARGWGILPLGLVGLFLVVSYTPWVTRKPWLCLWAPGVAFGPLMVMGTTFVLLGHYTLLSVVVSLVPLGLVSALLLLNQFPDIKADGEIGRRTLPIVIGRGRSAKIYAKLVVGPFVVIALALVLKVFPLSAAWALLGAPVALLLALGVRQRARDLPKLLPLMGVNVGMILGTILLLDVGLLLGQPA